MFAARASLLPSSNAGEVGQGGSSDLAIELNRIYAEPMPVHRQSMIPGVGLSGRSGSHDQPGNSMRAEEFPLMSAEGGNSPTKTLVAQQTLPPSDREANVRSPPYSLRSASAFEEDRLNTKYKLGWRRTLHNKRRQVADYSTVVALIGIAVMILETELSMANICAKTEFCSIFLKSFVSLSTLTLICLLLYYHYIEVEIFKVDNSVDDWRIAVSPVRVLRVLVEIAICLIHPVPIDCNITMYAISDSSVKEVSLSLDIVLGVPMFLRLYLLARLLLLHSRLFTDASSRSIGALNRITFNARFVLKTLMTMCPGTVLMTFILTMFIIGSWILRICETAHNPAYYNLLNSMWLISITFLAVGYGDFAPETYCGRTVAVFSGFMGAGCTALVVAVVARKLELTRSEKHVHNFMMNTQLSKRLKDSAANVLRETWLIFKYSKLAQRPNSHKIREHQRKFLTAIKNLRKVKLEQRKIAEQCHNLVDFPKVLMGISDTVVEARTVTVDNAANLQRRIDSIEKDVLEVKAHLLSLQSGLLQMMADFRESAAATQAVQHLQLQLLQLKCGQPQAEAGYDQYATSPGAIPSTAVLVSPPDYHGDPGSGAKLKRPPAKGDRSPTSLVSPTASSRTVVQLPAGRVSSHPSSSSQVSIPRATSALERVAAAEPASGSDSQLARHPKSTGDLKGQSAPPEPKSDIPLPDSSEASSDPQAQFSPGHRTSSGRINIQMPPQSPHGEGDGRTAPQE